MTIGCSVVPSTLRARIDGAVIRLPGTGDGVARLVLVSMVKVDMAAASSGRAQRGPVLRRYGRAILGTWLTAVRRESRCAAALASACDDGDDDDRPPFDWRRRPCGVTRISDHGPRPAAAVPSPYGGSGAAPRKGSRCRPHAGGTAL